MTALGTSGWKARQDRARAKMTRGKTQEERQAIRAERARIYAEQDMQTEKASEGTGEAMTPVKGDTLSNETVDTTTINKKPVADMTRDELVTELTDSGDKKPGPNTKLETLRQRVEALHA